MWPVCCAIRRIKPPKADACRLASRRHAGHGRSRPGCSGRFWPRCSSSWTRVRRQRGLWLLHVGRGAGMPSTCEGIWRRNRAQARRCQLRARFRGGCVHCRPSFTLHSGLSKHARAIACVLSCGPFAGGVGNAYADIAQSGHRHGKTVDARGLAVAQCPNIDAERAIVVDTTAPCISSVTPMMPHASPRSRRS